MTDRFIISIFCLWPILGSTGIIVALDLGLVAGYTLAVLAMIFSVLMENTLIKRFVDNKRGKW